jgi:hypothetical protein
LLHQTEGAQVLVPNTQVEEAKKKLQIKFIWQSKYLFSYKNTLIL